MRTLNGLTGAQLEFYGRACLTSKKTLPHMAIGGRPSIGLTFSAKLYAGLPSTPALLLFAVTRSNFDLGLLGAPGCTLYALPILSLVTTTGSDGRAAISLQVPRQPQLIGGELQTQWMLFDPAANRFGFVGSTAARIKLGRQ